MRILILFTFLITNALGNELPDLKNLVVHKIPKIYDNVIFLDDADKEINIQNLDSKLIILNFWATWCEPCKEEMPSLNRLQANQKLKNLELEWHVARIKHCGNFLANGINVKKDSVFYNVCKDVYLTPKPNQIEKHYHSFSIPEKK